MDVQNQLLICIAQQIVLRCIPPLLFHDRFESVFRTFIETIQLRQIKKLE